jgi:hypothetical protein
MSTNAALSGAACGGALVEPNAALSGAAGGGAGSRRVCAIAWV